LGNRQQFTIGVALSGGGFRATLHSLGVLLYLVDAGINKSVTSIVSVSGGSITSAYVGQYGDFADMRRAEFREIASKLARFVVNDGLIPSLWTHVYFCILIGFALFLGHFS
jgi:Patatin-like phospholipase